jgi:hypothetical protein
VRANTSASRRRDRARRSQRSAAAADVAARGAGPGAQASPDGSGVSSACGKPRAHRAWRTAPLSFRRWPSARARARKRSGYREPRRLPRPQDTRGSGRGHQGATAERHGRLPPHLCRAARIRNVATRHDRPWRLDGRPRHSPRGSRLIDGKSVFVALDGVRVIGHSGRSGGVRARNASKRVAYSYRSRS